jgi:TonB family protein
MGGTSRSWVLTALTLCGLTFFLSEGRSFGRGSSEKAQTTVDLRPPELANLLVSKVEPEYPEKALSAKLSGPVAVTVVVGPDGSVIEAKMECGNDHFEKAATTAVKQWHFKSPVLHGQPINVRGIAIVDFNLPGNSTQGQDFEVDSETALSHLESYIPPEYPANARIAHIQGCVLLHVQVDEAGAVKDVSVRTGHPLLVPPTEKAVKQWRYKPFLRSGVATAAKINVIVVFSLRG